MTKIAPPRGGTLEKTRPLGAKNGVRRRRTPLFCPLSLRISLSPCSRGSNPLRELLRCAAPFQVTHAPRGDCLRLSGRGTSVLEVRSPPADRTRDWQEKENSKSGPRFEEAAGSRDLRPRLGIAPRFIPRNMRFFHNKPRRNRTRYTTTMISAITTPCLRPTTISSLKFISTAPKILRR